MTNNEQRQKSDRPDETEKILEAGEGKKKRGFLGRLVRSVWFWLFFILLFVGAIWGFTRSNQPPVYTSATVEKRNLNQVVSATGVVEFRHELDLNFEAAGRVAKLAVSEGDKITQGELLTEIDVR